MVINVHNIQLSPLVYYDIYDGIGLLLAIQQGILLELNERETMILSEFLSEFRGDAVQDKESDGIALLERLRKHNLIIQQSDCPPCDHDSLPLTATPSHQTPPRHCDAKNLWQERLLGAEAIISVLNELRQSFYRAYQFLHLLEQKRSTKTTYSEEEALARANHDYWIYRLITGCFERKVAHLLGQAVGEEGLCLVKGFALCAYLLAISVPAQIIIARPRYGSGSNFKLHAWVEVQGKPLNEHVNIHDGFRTICVLPHIS